MKRDLLAVVLIAVMGLFVLGAAGPDRGDPGRYQVVQVPGLGVSPAGGDVLVLLLDTATGQARPLERDRDALPRWAAPLTTR